MIHKKKTTERRHIRLLCAACAAMLIAAPAAVAQSTFAGTVTDERDSPLEGAAVILLQGAAGKMIGYTLTDAGGTFRLSMRRTADSLQLSVSMLGYRTDTLAARTGAPHRIRLRQQAFQLREVEVRPGRVWGVQDTVNYDVSKFLSAHDETIKDVIRKLPGVDVDEHGKISYNGRDISRFYVEGMDLAGGQYNRITDNLPARSVEAVQLLENHQPLRILKDKLKTDAVALNLKLKPEFRARWMLTLQGGAGAAPLLWEGAANAMRLSRASQSACAYKANNTGHDAGDEQMAFYTHRSGQMEEAGARPFLNQPSLMAPLKTERLLFNGVHTLSANRLYKLDETKQARINAACTHDVRQQERGSETSYYLTDDAVRIAEQSHTRIRSDKAELSVHIEDNGADKYLTNHFETTAGRTHSIARFTGLQPLEQRLETANAGIRNDFNVIRNRNGYTLQAHSLVRYNHLPSHLAFDATDERLNLNLFYTDNSLSYIRKTGSLTRQYTAGASGQASNIRDGIAPYVIPSWQWNTAAWNASLSAPLVYTRFRAAAWKDRFAANPQLFLRCKINYAWHLTFMGAYRESYGDITGFYEKPYHASYRTIRQGDGILPVNRLQVYSLSAEYKRTTREFFATISLNHSRTHSSRIIEQRFDDTQMLLVAHELPNEASGWTARGIISKGFYDYGLKVSLDYVFNRSRGEQLSVGERLPIRSTFMQYDPKITWTPSRSVEISYLSTFRHGGSTVGSATRLTPLWNMVQKLQFACDVSDVRLLCRIDHYRNDVSAVRSVNVFFGDVSLQWKTGSWQLSASVSNLFDKRQYSYTEYASTQSYTSWIHIRGREFLASAKYRF
jgi:hypothetical protein